jgi:hypothetical protein
MAEQARIKAQLDIEGMQEIQVGLELTHITEDEQMSVDKAPEPRPIDAKLRALEKFVRVAFKFHHPSTTTPSFFIIFNSSACLAFVVPSIIYMLMILKYILQFVFWVFREPLSVSNMVTRCQDFQLKKP